MMWLNSQRKHSNFQEDYDKEFFAPDPEEKEINDLDNGSDEIPKIKKEQSSFVPPAGRDSSLDFYIEVITYEILQNTKKYKYNCNLRAKNFIRLSHDDKIIIKKADKSLSVVIMNRTDYIEEVERQLKNEKYYKHLNEDPSENIDKNIIRTLNNIAQKEHKEELNDLMNANFRVPQFYVLPKIHKEYNATLPVGYPGRPIVSACIPAQKIFQGSLTKFCNPM